jgi:hypothetical protein
VQINLNIVDIAVIVAAFMTIVGFGTWAVSTIKKMLKPISDIRASVTSTNMSMKVTNEAIKASLKYSIVRAHQSYMREGKIGRLSLQCIFDMHDQYVALGGNGFISNLVEELKELPIDMGYN